MQADPAHPLRALSDLAASPEVEHRDELCQHGATGVHDEAEARVDEPDTGIARGERGLLPLAHDIRQKAGARRALLIEQLVATRSVEPDGGPGEKHARRLSNGRHGLRENLGAANAAREDR